MPTATKPKPKVVSGDHEQSEAFRLLRRARLAAIDGGLINDRDTFLVYPETHDAQRIREAGEEPPERRHERRNDEAAARLALWHEGRTATAALTRIEGAACD